MKLGKADVKRKGNNGGQDSGYIHVIQRAKEKKEKTNFKNDVFVINSFSNLSPEDKALNGLDVFLLKHTWFNEWFFIRLSEQQKRILHRISAQLGDHQKEGAGEVKRKNKMKRKTQEKKKMDNSIKLLGRANQILII